MYYFLFLSLLANLQTNNEMDKEKKEKLTSMGLVAYHNALSDKDRVKLKNYVSLMLGLSYAVVHKRFIGGMAFSTAELIALQSVIENESWKQ